MNPRPVLAAAVLVLAGIGALLANSSQQSRAPTQSFSAQPPLPVLSALAPNTSKVLNSDSNARVKFYNRWPRGNLGWVRVKKERTGTAAPGFTLQADWDISVNDNTEGGFTVHWTPRSDARLSKTIAASMFMPTLSVAANGTATIAPGETSAYVSRVAKLSRQPLSPAVLDATGSLSEQDFTSTWAALFGSWVDREIELGQTAKQVAAPFVSGSVTAKVDTLLTSRGFVPCTIPSTQATCISLELRAVLSGDELKRLGAQLLESLGAPALPGTPEQIEAKSRTETAIVLLDPTRTLPYRFVFDRSTLMRIQEDDRVLEHHEEWLFYWFPAP